MKPVDQTVFDDTKGDCFRACIASLLELPIEEIPNFVESEDMTGSAKKWLKERGLTVMPMSFFNPEEPSHVFFDFQSYCIIGGTSPRKDAKGNHKRHAVVGKTKGWGLEIVHDPHPSREKLLNWGHWWVWFIVPTLDITNSKTW